MLKRLIFVCFFCLNAFSGDLILDDFRGNGNCDWRPCKWETHENASCKVEQGKMILDFGTPIKGKKGGFSFDGRLKQKYELENYKYISFKARCPSGTGSMRFQVQREKPEGQYSIFYSIVTLTPEWKTYSLQLRSSDRSMAGKGVFARVRSDSEASRQLDGGGKLHMLMFYAEEPLKIEVADIELKTDISRGAKKDKAITETIDKHKKYSPYKFRKIIAKNGPILVENNRSSFVVYVAPGTGNTGKFAAAQLTEYIRKSTGAELEIVDKMPKGKNIIELSIALNRGRNEGFQTEALTPGKIVISGDNERGLLYGVYDFLEKALGIRWLAPFSYGEIIPENRDIKLPLWQDESFPKMIYRRFHYCSAERGVPDPMAHRYTVADWCVKNRFNVELERLVNPYDPAAKQEKSLVKVNEFYAKRGGYVALPAMWGHNYHYWVSPKKYFAANPEFFCLDASSGKWQAKDAQLCATNPEVVKIIVDQAVEFFAKYPEREYFPLFQEDGSLLWCQCEKCRKLYKDTDMNSYKTEHSINLANQAAEISKKVPGKKVATYAYSVTTRPPVNVKPREDVFVTYCLSDFSNPDAYPWRGAFSEELDTWNKLCKGNLILYTYNYLDIYYTASTPDSLINAFRYFELEKIKCSCQESNENWYGVSAYNYYLSARLAWDPWFNDAEFRQDYYSKLYGRAAEYIESYHNLLENALIDKKYWLEYGNSTLPYIPDDKLQAMEQLIIKAQAATKDDKRLTAAVHAQAQGLEYVKVFSKAVAAGAEFQRTMESAKYEEAVRTLDELDTMIKCLIPSRLVPALALDKTRGMRRNMRDNYLRSKDFKKLGEKYNVRDIIKDFWRLKSDPLNQGERDKWFAVGLDDSKWMKAKSGDWWDNHGLKNYIGAAWYRINLNIPAGGKMALYFVGADERAWVYLDGKYIGGHHEGKPEKLWNEPFLVKLPQEIAPGKHQLTVKVHSCAGKGGLWKDVMLVQEK